MCTSCSATASTPVSEAVTVITRPMTSRATDGRRHRPTGSFPSGNTQSKIATKARNSGQHSWTITDSEPSGSVPWCIR